MLRFSFTNRERYTPVVIVYRRFVKQNVFYCLVHVLLCIVYEGYDAKDCVF